MGATPSSRFEALVINRDVGVAPTEAFLTTGFPHNSGQDFCHFKMARYEHLPIYRDALNLAVHFEKIVANFYSGLPALRPSGRSLRVQNRS